MATLSGQKGQARARSTISAGKAIEASTTKAGRVSYVLQRIALATAGPIRRRRGASG
jgi:hypothetical protein